MRMRLTLLVTALLSTSLVPRAQDAEQPNVVIVVMDDVALWDADRIELPTLDALAAEGVSFRRAYAMPTCSPTRQSLFFGEYTGRVAGFTCSMSEDRSPDLEAVSLAETMRAAGYATAIFGKWHMGAVDGQPWESSPQHHGFDAWRAGIPSNVTRCNGKNYSYWTRVDDGEATLSTEYHGRALRDEFVRWWGATEGSKFAYVAFQAPHVPFHTPPEDLLPEGYSAEDSARGLFESMLVSLDFTLRQMLDVVDRSSTWVFVLGDNGTPPEARIRGLQRGKLKKTSFENGVKVPMVVAGPGLESSHETEALVHVVDLYATIAELVGAEVPDGAARDSVSFAPCLARPEATVRDHVICDYVEFKAWGQPGGKAPKRERAVVTSSWKLRRYGKRIEELYDLENDPTERTPIAPDEIDDASPAGTALRRLTALLDEYESRGE